MDIKELGLKYKLDKEKDIWNCQGTWVVKHDAIEKIMAIEKIIVSDIKVLNSDWDFCRLLVTCSKKDGNGASGFEDTYISITSIGEALLNTSEVIGQSKYGKDKLKGNCESQYIGSMAEKRGIDRCVLKLIGAYQYGIYSDQEADSFKKDNQASLEVKPIDPIITKQQELLKIIGDDIKLANEIKATLKITNSLDKMTMTELDSMINEARKV